MRPSALVVLFSVFTSLVGASIAAKGDQTVAIYYAYSLEWLAKNKNPRYVPAFAKLCHEDHDCSTFAKFLETNMRGKPLQKAKNTLILRTGGPLDTNNPGDEAAKAYSESILSGAFDNEKMYGPETPVQEKFGVMATRISDIVHRARISLNGQGQDTIDKIAHHFEKVLSPDKVAQVERAHGIKVQLMADNPNEIDWLATYKANPNLARDEKTQGKVIETLNNFEKDVKQPHEAAIQAGIDLVKRLDAPLSC
ncbi:unnamed protein product [Aureobasidium mustum]|uniref:Uncharacterized protein n=1 Tax=Aureobasidium mustum TaxID=2773714 RepID=A0A9N8K295_9PEZI|nr:unnamed protein product [Aureobasidium mustum]